MPRAPRSAAERFGLLIAVRRGEAEEAAAGMARAGAPVVEQELRLAAASRTQSSSALNRPAHRSLRGRSRTTFESLQPHALQRGTERRAATTCR